MSLTVDSEAKLLPSHQLNDKFIPALDGWRGVAIAMVLLWHIWPTHGGYPKWFVSFGWMGVDLFFVLSGFLITRILLAAKLKGHYFKNFYARRFFRVFPLYYLTLTIVYLVSPMVWESRVLTRSDFINAGFAFSFLTNYWSGLHHQWFVGSGPFVSGHLWSLAVEEQFYLAWPLIVFMLNKSQLLVVCVICAAFSVSARFYLVRSGHDAIIAYVLTPFRLDGLAAGAALAISTTIPDWAELSRKICYIALPASLLGALAVAIRCRGLDVNHNPSVQTWSVTFDVPLFASLLFLTMALPAGNILDRTMRFAPLRMLGKYSYGIYVYHGFLLLIFEKKLWPISLRLIPHPMLATTVFFCVCTAFVIAVAVASFHFIEQPVLRLKRYFPEPMSPDSRQ